MSSRPTEPLAPVRTTADRDLVVEGARAITPMVAGVVPFGLAVGAAIATSDVHPVAAWAGCILIFAGSAHLTIVELLDAGANPVVIVLVALIINARLVLYGAGLAPWFPTTRTRVRLLLAAPIVDQLYLVAMARFERDDLDERGRRLFYTGAALHLAAGWVAAQTVGLIVGDGLPSSLGLHMASPLVLTGLLALSVPSRTTQLVAAGAAAATLVAAGLPHHSGIIVGIGIGIGVGIGIGADRRAP